MNGIKAGIFQRMRRKGDGFVCEVSTSNDWRDHEHSAKELVGLMSGPISKAIEMQASVTLDMALDVADFTRSIECVHFGAELLKLLGVHGISLEVTVYTGL
jgi:hypothetical protein